MVRKTRAKKSTTSSSLAFESDRFRFEKKQDTYEKLNIFRSIWAEHKVILDELDLAICRNFAPTALIRKFYLNFSVHSDDSNVQYVITPSIWAEHKG